MPDAYDAFLSSLKDRKNGELEPVKKREDAYARFLESHGKVKDKSDDTDSFIAELFKNIGRKTSLGIAGRSAGIVDEPTPMGMAAEIATEIGSFFLDPATYATGGLGSIIGKQAAKKLGTYFVSKGLIGTGAKTVEKLAASTTAAGIQLGGLEAVRGAAGGEFKPGEIAKATIAGAAFGPAGLIKQPLLRAGAEVAAMGVVPPLLEGGLPTSDDWINAAGTFGGFKLANAVMKAVGNRIFKSREAQRKAVEAEIGKEQATKVEAILSKAGQPKTLADEAIAESGAPQPTTEPPVPFLKGEGPSPLDVPGLRPEVAPTAPINRQLAALADKPTVSRKEYAEATGQKIGHVPLAVERKALAVAEAEKLKQEIANAEGQVPDVRKVEGEARQQEPRREDYERGGEAGAAVAPQEKVADTGAGQAPSPQEQVGVLTARSIAEAIGDARYSDVRITYQPINEQTTRTVPLDLPWEGTGDLSTAQYGDRVWVNPKQVLSVKIGRETVWSRKEQRQPSALSAKAAEVRIPTEAEWKELPDFIPAKMETVKVRYRIKELQTQLASETGRLDRFFTESMIADARKALSRGREEYQRPIGEPPFGYLKGTRNKNEGFLKDTYKGMLRRRAPQEKVADTGAGQAPSPQEQVGVLTRPSTSPRPPSKLVSALKAISDKYQDLMSTTAEDFPGELAESGNIDVLRRGSYDFTENFAGEARQMQENLPQRLRRHVRVLKSDHPDYRGARSEEIMQTIGMDAMVQSVVAAHPKRAQTANVVVDFFDQPTNKRFLEPNELESIIEYKRWREGITAERVKVKDLQAGESVKIAGEPFFVEKKPDGTTKLADDVDLYFGPDESLRIDHGSRQTESAQGQPIKSETQRPGLFGQETFDPLTGNQRALEFGEAPERATPDVPGQLTFAEPTTLSSASAKARASADAAFKDFTDYTKGMVFVGVDPKAVTLLAKYAAKEVRAGALTFADFVTRTAQRIGREATIKIKAFLREAWESVRGSDPRLGPAGDVDAILAKVDVPAKVSEIARPDLAVPVTGETAREALNVADTLRTAAGAPARVTHAEAGAVANQRIAERGPEYVRRLIDEGWVATDAPDTRVQIKVLNALSKRVGEASSESNWKDLAKASMNYRQGGTQEAQAFDARKSIVEDLTQPEQYAFFAAQELAKPPKETEKAIIAAKKQEAATPTKPGEKPKPKKSDQLWDEWAQEIKKYEAKLTALGHDVPKALRGELDPLAQQAFLRDVHAIKSSVPDWLYEWWRESILSGPVTNVTNAVGNAAHGAWYFTANRITDAFVSSIARGLGFKAEGAYFGELKYIARAFMESRAKAAASFMQTWRTELPQFYLTHGRETEAAAPHEYATAAISGRKGWWIRRPSGLMTAVDDYMKTQVAAMERDALAYRQAKNEKRSGEDLTDRIRELANDPASEVSQRAVDTAIRLAFQTKTKNLTKALGLRSDIPGARYLFPFVTTPFNILKTGVRYSPFGSAKLAKELFKAHSTGNYSGISTRVAEQVLAWGTTLALFYMNDPADPWITGGADQNRRYSVKIGGQWYYYGRIEPFATTLGLLVDSINRIHQGADVFETLKAPFDALAERVENQTFFTGISDFMKAARYQDSSYVLQWASKFPSSWVPNLVRAPLRATTESLPQRRVWGKGEQRAERILRRGAAAFEVLPEYPKYDLWGRPVPRDGGPLPGTDWLFRTLSPAGERKYVETIGDRLLTRWNAKHPDDRAEFKPPNPYYVEDGKTHYFSDADYDRYVRESGKLTQERVIMLHARGLLNMDNPTERDVDRLRRAVERSRARVRNAIKRGLRTPKRKAA